MQHRIHSAATGICLIVASAFVASGAAAQQHAHVHGVVRLDVAVDGHTLTFDMEAPLDSLLGFEHRPRTPAQRQAADALLKKMRDASSLIHPDAAAKCSVTEVKVESEALKPDAKGPPAGKGEEHADLDVYYTFTCEQPERLGAAEIGLFDAFKRIQRIESQVAAGKGQFKQTLQRPEKTLRLMR